MIRTIELSDTNGVAIGRMVVRIDERHRPHFKTLTMEAGKSLRNVYRMAYILENGNRYSIPGPTSAIEVILIAIEQWEQPCP